MPSCCADGAASGVVSAIGVDTAFGVLFATGGGIAGAGRGRVKGPGATGSRRNFPDPASSNPGVKGSRGVAERKAGGFGRSGALYGAGNFGLAPTRREAGGDGKSLVRGFL